MILYQNNYGWCQITLYDYRCRRGVGRVAEFASLSRLSLTITRTRFRRYYMYCNWVIKTDEDFVQVHKTEYL